MRRHGGGQKKISNRKDKRRKQNPTLLKSDNFEEVGGNHQQTLTSTCLYYKEGLDQKSRRTALHNWLTGKTKILIATKAAGAGIDKTDVQYVIQIGTPDSIEAHYQ